MFYTRRRQAKSENEIDEKDIKPINRKHNKFLLMAAEVAEKSTMLHKHGAVVVYKNNILSTGFNYMCDHMNDNFSIHAEVAAISKLFHQKQIFEECDIYVVRIASSAFDNCLKNSKPCRSCTTFINKYHLRNTYFSTSYKFNELIMK